MAAEHADVGLFENSELEYARVEFVLERLDPWPEKLGETIPKSRYRATVRTRAQPPGE